MHRNVLTRFSTFYHHIDHLGRTTVGNSYPMVPFENVETCDSTVVGGSYFVRPPLIEEQVFPVREARLGVPRCAEKRLQYCTVHELHCQNQTEARTHQQ